MNHKNEIFIKMITAVCKINDYKITNKQVFILIKNIFELHHLKTKILTNIMA